MSQTYPIPRELRMTGVLSGDGGATYGPFTFQIWDPVDVVALIKPQDQSWGMAGVTVAKVANQPFDYFRVTFAAPVPATSRFVVLSRRVQDKLTGVRKGNTLSLDALDKELSKQATVLQELRRDLNQAILNNFDGDRATIEGLLSALLTVSRLKSAAFEEASAFATAAQGARADTALQPGSVLLPTRPVGFDMLVGQTSVTIPGGYPAGSVFAVTLNGVTLEEGRDYAADDGAHVVLAAPIPAGNAAGARLTVRIADVYAATGDVFDGGVI